LIRDEELKRLVRYAQGLNCTVRILQDFEGNDAAGTCTTDGSMIEIYKSDRRSKIELIMTLIHEIGHLQYNVHNFNREPDPRLETALGDDTEKKRHRRIIYEYEKASSAWWDVIYHETGMSFPFYWLERQREFDVWQYHVWMNTGEWPKQPDKINKRKKLRKKYASKKIDT
jgi:hypothetical protein